MSFLITLLCHFCFNGLAQKKLKKKSRSRKTSSRLYTTGLMEKKLRKRRSTEGVREHDVYDSVRGFAFFKHPSSNIRLPYGFYAQLLLLPWPKNRYSREIHEVDRRSDHVISCNIELRFDSDATCGSCASRARVADRSRCREISHDRTADQSHEYLGCNDFFLARVVCTGYTCKVVLTQGNPRNWGIPIESANHWAGKLFSL